MQAKNAKILLIIILLAVIAGGIFIYPKGPGAKLRPWRLGLDLVGGAHLVYEVDMAQVKSGDRDSVMAGLRDVIERRINLFGVSEPRVTQAKEGDSFRLIVELAGVKDIGAAVEEIGQTPLLDFREVVEIPAELSAATTTGDTLFGGQANGGATSSPQVAFSPTDLTGRYIIGAQVDIDQTTGQVEVNLEFNEEGAKIFEDLTARNVGKPVAIFLDNKVIQMPRVNEKISGGKARITGLDGPEEAKQLVQRFNAGALPAPIKLISQQAVGASLGQESLQKAIYAGILGTLIVILFMVVYYRKLGIFASLALAAYIILAASIFKLGITMTLAGIAGFILSIGMAVDANILVFERTKEELKKGVLKTAAIEEGFKRAWPSIRDSNVSTIITSVILYEFTSSFVRGFALTLLLGVLISMFSAITITRSMLRVFMTGKEK